MSVYISLTVSSDSAEQVTRTFEALARCAAGLALEGLQVSVSAGTTDDAEAEN